MTVNPKGFSDIDNVVKEAIRQYLPPETLAASSATSKLFQKMMADKQTWVGMAKKLHMQPKSAETAKEEVVARLKFNRHFLNVFKTHHIRFNPKEIQQLDQFSQNERIDELLKPKLDGYDRKILLEEFENALERINEQSHSKEDVEIVLRCIKQCHLLETFAEWKFVLKNIPGMKKNSDDSYTYFPEHLIIFKELMRELKNLNANENTIHRMLEPFFNYGYASYFPNDVNYPHKFIEAALETGCVRPITYLHAAILGCHEDLWCKTEGSPITQLLQYATDAERNMALKQVPDWFHEWELKLDLAFAVKDTPGSFKLNLHRLIHWPFFVALLEKRSVTEEETKKMVDFVNQKIDEAEQKDSSDKEYYNAIRALAKELQSTDNTK